MDVKAFLAAAPKGVHAHALEHPGCFARGATREEALARLRLALHAYLADLARHGEAVELASAFNITIAEVDETASGPFDPGDTAALFEMEKSPITAEEMARFFSLAEYNRRDLLVFASDLPDELLDWEAPGYAGWPIRRILRHIGNADQWYVSRVTVPDEYPPEWEDDDRMPVYPYLEMARRTSIQVYRGFALDRLDGRVLVPAHSTDSPGEPWTLRKSLRRTLEHEREHTGHIREVMALWRAAYLARLAQARSDLLWSLREMSQADFDGPPVFDDWTAQDLLAHLAAWDRLHTRRITALLEGRAADILDISAPGFAELENARQKAAAKPRPVGDVFRDLAEARAAFLDAVDAFPTGLLHRPHHFPGGQTLHMSRYLPRRFRHDAMHREDFEAWQERAALQRGGPVKPLLLALLGASRAEFQTLSELIPAAERETRALTGHWTLRDITGHLADWERIALAQVRRALAGKETRANPEIEADGEDAFNDRLAAARAGRSWADAWSDYRKGRDAMLAALDGVGEETLNREMVPPWGGSVRIGDFFLDWAWHDRDHAQAIRAETGLPGI